ncbi:MAG: riboflavin synthase [Gemmatimonadetes bacterium]|nr:riboflavin synthase [Gemmatimonadota bacterium]
MFTGLVEAVGRVEGVDRAAGGLKISITAPFADELSLGQSIAVDGACLTVSGAQETMFEVTAVPATLERTVAGRYESGTAVNLERALRVGARLDGHLVQGHVDGLGTYLGGDKGTEDRRLRFRLPDAVARVTIPQGSITLSGISLTVAALDDPDVCTVAVIPHTWDHTNLSRLSPGDPVNVEGDLIGKYVLKAQSPWLTGGGGSPSGAS